ncbi:MAG TPA: efflux RND transporter periplasmic adaptor subunit [Terriglobales bacterium]|jgi:putative peptide zinc metalloprotease protein|nr:efflux RND transporter periplasmic adaptor subunit [Terriglobales bacterium]
MNLTEALDYAPIELAARREIYPKKHPQLAGRPHTEEGKQVVLAVISGKDALFRLSPEAWELVQLCDGKRSYEELAEAAAARAGITLSADEVREFALSMDASEFWAQSLQREENVGLTQKLMQQRQQHTAKKKSKFGDVSHIQFSAWDPDRALDWVNRHFSFLFSRWFTLLSLAGLVLTTYIFITRWHEIFQDTLHFFNVKEMSASDFAQFWVLAFVLLFFHEAAHGLAVRHYGGHVHRMGFHLIYMTPAFFVDVTEAWVYARKWQRIATLFAGVWSEMLFCFVATPIWWGTPPGTFLHELCYKVILFTGLAAPFFNWNPLIKLDGYYILSELLGIVDLKEKSTAYTSGWVKKNIFRLPVQVEYVPRRRRPLYAVYSLVSGAYSYSLLYFFARFIGNIFKHYNPEWSFIPALFVGYLMFRSRIRTLGRFMKTVYLDKRDHLRAWLTPVRASGLAVVLLVILVAPIWRQTASGPFVLEARTTAAVRAMVEGTVTAVYHDEGQTVAAGAPLVRLRNLKLESEAAQSAANYRTAVARAAQAQLHYADYGPAERERQQLEERDRILRDQVARLALNSPLNGAVITPRVHDLVGSTVKAGTPLLEVADLSIMRARVFVPEFQMRDVQPHAPARLLCPSLASSREGVALEVAAAPAEVEPGLIDITRFQGLRPPQFYSVLVEVANPEGALRVGMTGTAKIYVRRRSLLGLAWQEVHDFLGRKIW